MNKQIGFLGLGKMGLPMARHLQTHGHTVTGYDPSAERRAAVTTAGMAVAPSVEALIAHCAVIVSSLPNDAALDRKSVV